MFFKLFYFNSKLKFCFHTFQNNMFNIFCRLIIILSIDIIITVAF